MIFSLDNKALNIRFSYIIGIVIYLFSICYNASLVERLLFIGNISYNEIDKIDNIAIISSLGGAIALLLLYQLFSFKKILAVTTVIYFISVITLLFVSNSYALIALGASVHFASLTIIITGIINYVISFEKVTVGSCLLSAFLTIMFTYLLITIMPCFETIGGKVLSLASIIVTSILLVIIWFKNYFARKINLHEVNFKLLLQNIETELLSGFVILYVIGLIVSTYDSYNLLDSLFTAILGDDKYYLVVLMVLSLIISNRFLSNVKLSLVPAPCAFVLFVLFVSLPIWSKHYVISLALWLVIFISCYISIASNLLILSKKFSSNCLISAISIYFIFCALGLYVQHMFISNSQAEMGENNILLSICFVIAALLVYYIYLFNRDKLIIWRKN